MATTTDQEPAVDSGRLPPRPGPFRSAIAFLRNTWRGLTSMRTALILLFLLALASLPGALLPQWALNTDKTSAYIAAHPFWGPLLNKLEFFDVFGSVWYSAIYLLLFISLIGCLVPRTFDFARHLRDKPVATPRNLSRMPLNTVYQVDAAAGDTADKVGATLRSKHWRVAVRTESAGVQTISAEKGYLREIGNLVFHFSLVGLLIAVAVGELFGFDGSVIKDVDGQPFCSSSPTAYDNFRPGLTVDGTDMAPFCVRLNTFQAGYAPSGQAVSFSSGVQYQAGADAGSDTWHSATLQVNDPLRMDGERLYLLGQGYAPTVRITFPNGAVRDETADFISSDSSLLSTGAIKVPDPPGVPAAQLTKHQLAIAGLFAPTAVVNGGIMTSVFPAADKPGLAIRVYRGDLGMEAGVPQSVYAIDQGQVDAGRLVLQKQVNLFVGQSVSLGDGTKITFTGYKHWVALQTSYDPAQFYALIFAITLLCGLMLSLTIKRRRLWFRFVPAAPAAGAGETDSTSSRTVVHVGGLARTDQAGYGSEFDAVSRLADGDEPAEDRSRAMSAFSDLAFQAAMAAYLVALVCYGIELASRRGLVPTALEAASMQRRVEARAGVGVTAVSSDGTYSYGGGGGADTVDGADQDRDDDDDDDGPRRPLAPWGVRFGRAAVVVTVVGVLANAISVVTRGLTADRLPLANLYEFSSMLCLASVTCWLIVLRVTGARPLGLFVMTPVALLAFIAGTVLWIPAGPVMPSLNSYWKWIHVTTVSISGSVLLVSGAASVMYLLRHRFDRKISDTPDDPLLATSVWGRLPSLQVLDKIAYRTAIVAFPLYTFAVIAGSLWAEVAWGKYWSWDPKETVAFVSWVFYAGYLHARATSGWRGVRSAWINICGFAAIVFNLFFVNFVISGLHSYAGVG